MLNNLLFGQTAEEKLYVEDVFSTYLYTGTGSSQTITNGIDLSGNGGMVWLKGRSGATDHAVYDTVRSTTKDLVTNSTAAETTQSTGLTAFGATGFTVGALAKLNTSAATYASWTFRKAPKFFDVVTYTGNGTAGRTISHSLGTAPGMIVVKRLQSANNWSVYHRSIGGTLPIYLNLTNAAATSSIIWNNTDPTDTVFTVGNSGYVNASGGSYVAYLFAHDTTADGIVQCGSFTSNGNNQSVNLGWEPQFLILKKSSATSDWWLLNNTNGVFDTRSGSGNASSRGLVANTSAAEADLTSVYVGPTATGFSHSLDNGATYIYLAIRRGPMRTPTDATKVFAPSATATTVINTILNNGTISPDLVMFRGRSVTISGSFQLQDALRGFNQALYGTATTSAEITTSGYSRTMTGVGYTGAGTGQNPSIAYHFVRAPSFFDVVCYTGTGSARTVSHNLGVAPELMIVKTRSGTTGWLVYNSSLGSGYYLTLNATSTALSTSTTYWNSTAPTDSVFSLGAGTGVNASGGTFVAYLFASCPSVSKVGSYTGNGSSINIECGFTNGARFVLIKRTDSTGDWYVWDTARGIVSGNDPHLSLNTTAAEVTSNDTIDPLSTGFTVNQVSATNVNVSSATYIYLAIA